MSWSLDYTENSLKNLSLASNSVPGKLNQKESPWKWEECCLWDVRVSWVRIQIGRGTVVHMLVFLIVGLGFSGSSVGWEVQDQVAGKVVSFWGLFSGLVVVCLLPASIRQREQTSSLVSRKATLVLYQGPTLLSSFYLNYFHKCSISKYKDSVLSTLGLDFNMNFGGHNYWEPHSFLIAGYYLWFVDRWISQLQMWYNIQPTVGGQFTFAMEPDLKAIAKKILNYDPVDLWVFFSTDLADFLVLATSFVFLHVEHYW